MGILKSMRAAYHLSLVLVVGFCLMAFLPGCGRDGFGTAPVKGKITYKGKPLTTGTILFKPEGDKPSATGEIQPDGTYVLTTYSGDDGAVLGKHDILITAFEDMSNRLPEDRSPAPPLRHLGPDPRGQGRREYVRL